MVDSFRQRWMQKWNTLWEASLSGEGKNKVKVLLENGNFILFFSCKGEVYGASEAARVTYAKLRDPSDEDNNDSWRREANFTATNLFHAVEGRNSQNVFYAKDLDDLKIITDKDSVEKLLVAHLEKSVK